MFSGIVEGLCKVVRFGDGRITVELGKLARGVRVGTSIAVNGTCLTVTAIRNGKASFDVVPETLQKTNLGELGKGSRVNIERSLKIGDELGGHFVLGHVDGKGTITKKDSEGIHVRVPKRLEKYLVTKGSVALDGVSLTIASVKGDEIYVALIPHTLKHTTLGFRKKGDKVNIEADYLAKLALKGK